jgi:hypothetical protein
LATFAVDTGSQIGGARGAITVDTARHRTTVFIYYPIAVVVFAIAADLSLAIILWFRAFAGCVALEVFAYSVRFVEIITGAALLSWVFTSFWFVRKRQILAKTFYALTSRTIPFYSTGKAHITGKDTAKRAQTQRMYVSDFHHLCSISYQRIYSNRD